jgi:hypothetical protein
MAHSPYPGDGAMLVAAIFFAFLSIRAILVAVKTRKHGEGWKKNAQHHTVHFFLSGCCVFLILIHRLNLAS